MAIKTGSAGNDTLTGTTAADTLTGGLGDDVLNGGLAADTYIFGKGHGYDTIDDYDTVTVNLDKVIFTDLTTNDVRIFRTGNDLVFAYGVDDQLTIRYYFLGEAYRIERFQFTNSTLSAANIATRLLYTEGDDSYVGFSTLANTINGLGGDDNITGGDLADTLFGSTGNDTLSGGGGNDGLYGGTGNDTLTGGEGTDVYYFYKGDGNDVIADYHASSVAIDRIDFRDVTAAAVTRVYRDGNALVIEYGAEDSVTVSNYFLGTNYQVEQVKFIDGQTWTRAEIAQRLQFSDGDDYYSGFEDLANNLSGLAGNDALTGGALADRIDGGEGSDLLNGGSGADQLIGGEGNDSLVGGGGSDTYALQKGSGIDTIDDYSAGIGDVDTVTFADVNAAEVQSITRQGNHLLVKYGATDTVVVSNYFLGTAYQVDRFAFADKTVWDKAAIATRLAYTSGNDDYSGFSDVANTIHGLAGADQMTGGSLGDALYGDAGNDTLTGGEGADTLIGGVGSDLLKGGAGADTYRFVKGDGADAIDDYHAESGVVDTLVFDGISANTVTAVNRVGNHLVIKMGATDRVTINNYFLGANYQVESILFRDSTWNRGVIAKRLSYTEGNDTFSGFSDVSNTLHALGGNDDITGGDLADTLYGDDGDDALRGGAGTDVLSGDLGNDTLYGGAGNDVYQYRRGGGADRISDYDGAGAATDTVDFLDYSRSDLTKIARNGNDMILSFAGRDKVILENYYLGAAYRPEQYRFADGTVVKGFAVGAENDDQLTGTDGADYLDGGIGADTMTGGLGNDVYVINGADLIVEAANGGVDTVIVGSNYTIENKPYLENIILTGTGNFSATGNAANNGLKGNSGNNLLSGGLGNDYLDGGAGADKLSGLQGNDTYIIDNAGDSIQELEDVGGGYGGIDTVQTTLASYTLGAALENLSLTGLSAITGIGNAANNLIEGSLAANTLDGMGGKNVLGFTLETTVANTGVTLNLSVKDANGYATASGGSGTDKVRNFQDIAGSRFADTFTGDSANNSILGLGGNDTIYGGAGNDILSGGAGSDQLIGGAGADSFVFDAALGSTNIDIIKDFRMEDDVIGLSKTVFKALPGAASTVLNVEWLVQGTSAQAAITEADDFLFYNTGTGGLYYDADGSGRAFAPVQFATLTGAPVLTHLDFGIIA